MRSVYSAAAASEQVDINISPLIDVVFLLLIFFVVTTVFVEETGVEVDRPRASEAQDLDRRSLMLALTQDGRIMAGGREIMLNSVRGVVAQHLHGNPDSPVIILADRDARTGPLVSIVNECKRAGARQVSIAASREEGAP